MRRKLDVTRSEMQTLQEEEKLSHREIAKRLEISYNTVLRYLGPQPEWITEKNRRGKLENTSEG